jgi:hypothetical protein
MGQEVLATTRRSLHAVAELVLAGPQYRDIGKLRLQVIPGGFATIGTPDLHAVDTQVGNGGGVAVAISGRTARAIGAELGVTAGRPDGAYDGGSGVGLDQLLTLQAGQAAVVMGALSLGHDALTAFAPAQTPILWPEHFDVAIRADDTNYGVSPGDGFSEEPYAYVGVAAPPVGDAFWNAPFGAALPLRQLPDVAAVTAFFAEGRSRVK